MKALTLPDFTHSIRLKKILAPFGQVMYIDDSDVELCSEILELFGLPSWENIEVTLSSAEHTGSIALYLTFFDDELGQAVGWSTSEEVNYFNSFDFEKEACHWFMEGTNSYLWSMLEAKVEHNNTYKFYLSVKEIKA